MAIVRTSTPYNNTHEHAAVITRVWSDLDPATAAPGAVLVNLHVMPDASAPFSLTSVPFFDSKAEADASSLLNVSYWPPRI
jgi:hypothetical protein